jgi:hypothetical protein
MLCVCCVCCVYLLQAIVQSFLGFGLQGLKPRLGGWEWSELQELNAAIHWQVCRNTGWKQPRLTTLTNTHACV